MVLLGVAPWCCRLRKIDVPCWRGLKGGLAPCADPRPLGADEPLGTRGDCGRLPLGVVGVVCYTGRAGTPVRVASLLPGRLATHR